MFERLSLKELRALDAMLMGDYLLVDSVWTPLRPIRTKPHPWVKEMAEISHEASEAYTDKQILTLTAETVALEA